MGLGVKDLLWCKYGRWVLEVGLGGLEVRIEIRRVGVGEFGG